MAAGGAIDLAAALATLPGPYQPARVGTYNDNKLLVAQLHGEFPWHTHADTDDFFLVIDGRMTLRLREAPDVELGPGELYVVPAGVEHCPFAAEPCHVLLIERTGTVNTGDAGGPLTAPEPPT